MIHDYASLAISVIEPTSPHAATTQGYQQWGDWGIPPNEGVVPPWRAVPPSEKLLVPPQEDIGTPPSLKIFGALRTHLSYLIGNWALFLHKEGIYGKK